MKREDVEYLLKIGAKHENPLVRKEATEAALELIRATKEDVAWERKKRFRETVLYYAKIGAGISTLFGIGFLAATDQLNPASTVGSGLLTMGLTWLSTKSRNSS